MDDSNKNNNARYKLTEDSPLKDFLYNKKFQEFTLNIVSSTATGELLFCTVDEPNLGSSGDVDITKIKIKAIFPSYDLALKIEDYASVASAMAQTGRELVTSEFKFLQFQYYVKEIEGIELEFEEHQGYERIKTEAVEDLLGDKGLHPLILITIMGALTQA